MSNLVDGFAKTLRDHVWYFVGNLGVPGMADRRGYKCSCGWETRDDGGAELADPFVHVAEQLKTECQFMEERTDINGDPNGGWYGLTRSRWVTQWGSVP